MTALLAPFLTRFSALPAEPASAMMPDREPCLAISPSDLAARLDAAAAEAREEAERHHAAAIAALATTHAADALERLQVARAEWTLAQAEELASRLDAGLADLLTYLVDRIAAVLRPVVAVSLRDRLKQDVLEAIDRLPADPDAPLLSVRGPADLLDALRAARPARAIEWIADDSVDVSIAAGAARVEGRLAEALETLVGKEA